MSDHHADHIERFCREIGATWQWSATRGDHRRLTVSLAERRAIVIVASTPGDGMSYLNSLRDIRHGLGIVGGKRVGDRPATSRKSRIVRPRAATPELMADPRQDRFGARLAEIAEAMHVPEIPPIPAHAVTFYGWAGA